jgi:hypothetical protein
MSSERHDSCRGIEAHLLNELVKEIKGKKLAALGISQSKLPLLLLYSVLVVEGIRQAYLVDGIVLSADKLSRFLSTICLKLKRPLPVIVALDSGDVIIANKDYIKTKCADIDAHPSVEPSFLAIDISEGGIPHYVTEERYDAVRKALAKTVEQLCKYLSSDIGPLESDAKPPVFCIDGNLLNDIVGLPFFAGWLLGYPFVYLSLHAANCLSMVPLLKTSIACDITSYTRLFGHSLPRNDIDLYEFTVPEMLVPEASAEREFLSRWTSQRLQDVNEYLLVVRSRSDEGLSQIIDSVAATTDVFVLPHVML